MAKRIALLAVCLLPAFALHAERDDAALFKACPGLAAWAKTHPHGKADVPRTSAAGVSRPALRDALAARAAADQQARDGLTLGTPDQTVIRKMLAVDADNLRWLKDMIKKSGFPTAQSVGTDGVADAWLLLQHADADPALQTAVLETLRTRHATGGVRKSDLAMLTDRVLLAQGKPQRYASQFVPGADGRPTLQLPADMAGVDQRRADMDLMPLSAYRCVISHSYSSATDAAP